MMMRFDSLEKAARYASTWFLVGVRSASAKMVRI